ncbi:MAG: c-type cytochrome [Myxococcota bacterium]
MKRALWILGTALVLGLAAWLLLRTPDPLEILAGIEAPPSPVLSAEEEADTFRIAPDFRIELVASEPLVVDPVAMDWDDQGRLYVVEMRGYMPNLRAEGEDQPVGRVVLLEDTNGDGRMDTSRIYLDGLVLPRAIAVLPEGVLIGAPPKLLLCQDANLDDTCTTEEQRVLGDYAADAGNVEHSENALLPASDGWIYNSKSARRFRLGQGDEIALEIEDTLFRGQWGLAQDDEGHFFYNHNSTFLQADAFPGEYALRQPATAARIRKPGLGVDLTVGAEVYGARVMPGLNRARQPGTLRPNGRQLNPTGVSGLAIQRGDQYGEVFVGDAFIPESAGAAVAHFAIARQELDWRAAHRLYKDDVHGLREFLASTDERFRPVDAKVGPDGAIWILDMYRGVIQHADFVSDHLREYVVQQGLEAPGATGRIWRIVREDRPIRYAPPPLTTPTEQLAGLDHPNAWVRARAQRRLVAAQHTGAGLGEDIHNGLRQLDAFSEAGRHHALWTLALSGLLDADTWQRARADAAAPIRTLALRLSEFLPTSAGPVLRTAFEDALEDPDPRVQLGALHALGDLPPAERPIELLLGAARDAGPIERQAALSGLAGFELAVFAPEIKNARAEDEASTEWIEAVSTLAYAAGLASEDPPAAIAQIFATLAGDSSHGAAAGDDGSVTQGNAPVAGPVIEAALSGFLEAQQLPGAYRVVLRERPRLFDDSRSEARPEIADHVRRGITWPGDAQPGGARALSPEEEVLRAKGEGLFAATCATCHGQNGRGQTGLAPPLVRSPWVRDSDDWLIRIALHGLRGPLTVLGEEWNGSMPGHGDDPRFDDSGVAGLLTYLRRSWGHADAPVSVERVRAVRAASLNRREVWTTDELMRLPIAHRLDRFAGAYRVPVVGIELVIRREGSQLTIGRATGARDKLVEIGDGLFNGQGVQLRFDLDGQGPAASAHLNTGDFEVEAKRVSAAASSGSEPAPES